MAPRFGRPSPDPRLGSVIELGRRRLHRSFDLISVGKTLPGQRIAAEEPPPSLLEVEPTCPFGNEHVLDAWMVCQPSARLQAVVAAQIVRDNENLPFRVIRLTVLEQLNVVLGIARSGTARDLLAIANS